MTLIRGVVLGLGLVAAAGPAGAQSGVPDDWPAYGRDRGGERYSPLTGITRANVAKLVVAWEYRTGEAGVETGNSTSFEVTPLVLDGVMYLSTPLGKVIALDAETGRERWVTDLRVDRTLTFGDFTSRGVSLWSDPAARPGSPCARRVFAATVDGRLFALDAADGRRCAGFGDRGAVNLRNGLRNPPSGTEEYEVTSPPAIVGGLVVVGSAVADNRRTDAASGEVRGVDARTGAIRWSWDPVAQDPADPAWRTWTGPNAHRTGAANAWSVIAADSARGLVFVPTGSASPDYFGGERKGENRYANSIVALRAATGKVVWHFQTVHHDLWDYDNASPPALTTVVWNGRRIPVLIQTTKTGMMYVLHRETGVPVFPVEERPVPRSSVPGEEAWPTQPFTTGIAPLSPQRWSADSAWGPTPADRAACRERMAKLRNEGIFTPPSLEGSLVVPSNIGGAHWGGVAVDPERMIVVVPVNTLAAAVQLIPHEEFMRLRDTPGYRLEGSQYTTMHGTPFVMRRELLIGPGQAPCTPPPFGLLVAIDLATGARKWESPLGAFAPDAPAAAAWGSPNLGGPIVTAGGLVFIAATLDRRIHAYDIETGKELWSAPLPAGGKATPMTFRGRSGKQYVVIAAGGDGGRFGKSDRVVAFAVK